MKYSSRSKKPSFVLRDRYRDVGVGLADPNWNLGVIHPIVSEAEFYAEFRSVVRVLKCAEHGVF